MHLKRVGCICFILKKIYIKYKINIKNKKKNNSNHLEKKNKYN
jgi:hypothetical protein